jgi:hypothetical protein
MTKHLHLPTISASLRRCHQAMNTYDTTDASSIFGHHHRSYSQTQKRAHLDDLLPSVSLVSSFSTRVITAAELHCTAWCLAPTATSHISTRTRSQTRARCPPSRDRCSRPSARRQAPLESGINPVQRYYSIVTQRTRGKSRGWGLVFGVVQVRRSRRGKRTASEYHHFNVSLSALRLAFTTSGMMYSCNSLSRASVKKLGLSIFMFRHARAVSFSSNHAMVNV